MESAWKGYGKRKRGENDLVVLRGLDVRCIGIVFCTFLINNRSFCLVFICYIE